VIFLRSNIENFEERISSHFDFQLWKIYMNCRG